MRLQVKGRLQKVDKIDLLVDPVLLGGGPVAELLRLEPDNKIGYKIERDLNFEFKQH